MMDEEMITLDNVMPVELAIRRELEYRRKMEVMKKQHQIKLKPLVLFQGPPPSQTGGKRKAPASNCQGVPVVQPSSSCQISKKHFTGLVCKLCQVSFTSVFHLRQHCASRTHKNNLVQMKKRGEPLSNPLWCELCKSPGSSGIVLEQHLNGAKHAASIKELENAKHVRAEALAANR